MNEYKKIIRKTILIVIWTLFITFTLSGLITAYEQTSFVAQGKEYQTVKFDFDEIKKTVPIGKLTQLIFYLPNKQSIKSIS